MKVNKGKIDCGSASKIRVHCFSPLSWTASSTYPERLGPFAVKLDWKPRMDANGREWADGGLRK